MLFLFFDTNMPYLCVRCLLALEWGQFLFENRHERMNVYARFLINRVGCHFERSEESFTWNLGPVYRVSPFDRG